MSDINMGESLTPQQIAQYIAEQVASQTAQLRAALEQLQQGNAASFQNLQQQLAASQAAAGGAVGGGGNGGQQSNNLGSVQAAKPRTYSGNLGSDPSVWLFQYQQYVEVLGVPQSSWVRLAATYLDGKAATWWRGLVKQQVDENPNNITWDYFKESLIAVFKPVNSSKIARDRLAVLKQDKSVSLYNSRFTELVLEIDDIAESEKLDRYIRGLKRDIKMEVEKAEPNTLAEAMRIAQRYDSISYYSRQSTYNPNYQLSRGSNSSGPAPMDVSAISNKGSHNNNKYGKSSNSNNKSATPLQQLSREEFTYCQRNKLCLRCKEPGHLARNCTKPVKRLNLHAQ